MAVLNNIFGLCLFGALLVAGLLLMVAPGLGRQLFKNIAVFIALYLVGSLLLATCAAILRHGGGGGAAGILFSLSGFLAGGALVASAFLYLLVSGAAQRLLGLAALALGTIIFAIIALSEIEHAVGPIAFFVLMIAVSGLAYFVREGRIHPARREGSRYAERTPIMPQHVPDEDE